MLKFLMIVADPGIAAFAAANGVDRLFVDLERLGKAERQGHLDTVKSTLEPEAISTIREAAPEADLLVRLNPLHDGTAAEIDDAVARGADWLMQPMWRSADEVARFADLVRGRARLMPLAETVGAVAALPQIPPLVDATYIGLNDLHLDRGMAFMFEPLSDGSLEDPTAALRAAGTPFGIGGIARAGEGHLPPEIILGEHVRLGSDWVVLSRTFHRNAASVAEIEQDMDFAGELDRLRSIHARFANAPELLEPNRAEAARRIGEIADMLRARKA